MIYSTRKWRTRSRRESVEIPQCCAGDRRLIGARWRALPMMGITGGEATKQIKPVRNLAWGDYILRDQGQNTELAGSRWILMDVVSRVLPAFCEQVRGRVYPTFARLAKDRPGTDHGPTASRRTSDPVLAARKAPSA